MEIFTSLDDYNALKTIKKEPVYGDSIDSSNCFDGVRANLNFEKYYYKKELDLNWNEEGNASDVNCESFVNDPIKKNIDKTAVENETILIGQEYKRIVKIENPDVDEGEICKNLDFQKYHYKEELDLDWDERDNNYNLNHLTERSQQKLIEETNSTSVLQNKTKKSRSRKKKLEINPDTEKDCPKCNKSLKNLNTLNKHIYYCGKEPHLQCDSCSYKAKYKNALIVHIIRNHPQQISNSKKLKTTWTKRNKNNKVVKEQQLSDKCFRFCANCSISTDRSKLNKCSKCESQLLYQCQKCTEIFQSREKLTRHILDRCDPKGYYHCPACDYKDTAKQKVKFHLKMHVVPGSHLDIEDIKWKKVEGKDDSHWLTCPSCNKQFQRKSSLGSHMRQCIKSQGVVKPPTQYVKRKDPGHKYMIEKYCTKCNAIHQISKIMSETSECCGLTTLFKCSKCSRCYERFLSVYNHVRNICNTSKKYKCDKCHYEGSKKNLLSHLYYCSGKEPLKCDRCPFMTKRKKLFDAHILQKHSK